VFGAGLALAIQNATSNWETWYIWPLAPFGGAGLGRVAHGLFGGQSASPRSGALLVSIGIVLAVLGATIEGDVTTTILVAVLVLSGIGTLLTGRRPRSLQLNPRPRSKVMSETDRNVTSTPSLQRMRAGPPKKSIRLAGLAALVGSLIWLTTP
jgi:hypothetical protein